MSKIERELKELERLMTLRAAWFVAGLLFCTAMFLLFSDNTGMFFGGLYIGMLLVSIVVWSRCFGDRCG
jgi:hypothetical protein